MIGQQRFNRTSCSTKYVFRCKGGFHNGVDGDSGSNCRKVAPIGNSTWCSTFGNEKCADGCGFLDLNPKHHSTCPRINSNFLGKCAQQCPFTKLQAARRNKLLFHGCAFGVRISATLCQIRKGIRHIEVCVCLCVFSFIIVCTYIFHCDLLVLLFFVLYLVYHLSLLSLSNYSHINRYLVSMLNQAFLGSRPTSFGNV